MTNLRLAKSARNVGTTLLFRCKKILIGDALNVAQVVSNIFSKGTLDGNF